MGHGKSRHKKKPVIQRKQIKTEVIPEPVIGPDEAETRTKEITDMGEDVNSQNNKQDKETGTSISQATKKNSWGWLWAGAAGGCFVLLVICLIAFMKPEFRHSNYYVYEDPSMLMELLTKDLNAADSTAITKAAKEESFRRKDAIEDLLEQKVIVSSEEFASNISGYYNTLIAVLSAILIILNLFGFLSWRSNANSSLEQKQRELDDALNKIDDRLENNLEEILRKNQVVKERLQSYFDELLEQRETLSDEEWDKLHMLLTKYEKYEELRAIKNDNDEKNNGEIEA
jgi:predicted PurR-regulated permease PerM